MPISGCRSTAGARVLASFVLALPIGVVAQPIAEQTDWSGGPGAGVVADWDERFEDASSISWLAVPGQVALSATPVADPVQTIVAAEAGMPVTVAVGDVDGDGGLDIVSSDAVTQIFPESAGATSSPACSTPGRSSSATSTATPTSTPS